jgi:hypothetical protein
LTTETAPTVVGPANYIYAMYPIADCTSSFEEMGARFEQADPGFQDPLEIFDVRWNEGVNTSCGLGEKLSEPTILSVAPRYAKRVVSTNSVLRGPRVNPLPVDLRYRAHVVFCVLPHPLVVDLGDHRGNGQRILEIPSQLQGVVEVL